MPDLDEAMKMDDFIFSYHSSIIWSGENHAKINTLTTIFRLKVRVLNANPETLAELKEIRR